MKKLKLNSTAFAGAEVLSRAQLKKVMGGNPPITTVPSFCAASCSTCPSGQQLKSGFSGWTLSVDCNGVCVGNDEVGVTCNGVSTPCSDGASGYCVPIPITI